MHKKLNLNNVKMPMLERSQIIKSEWAKLSASEKEVYKKIGEQMAQDKLGRENQSKLPVISTPLMMMPQPFGSPQ